MVVALVWGWTPWWWRWCEGGHHGGGTGVRVDTMVVALVLGWTSWWWHWCEGGHHGSGTA